MEEIKYNNQNKNYKNNSSLKRIGNFIKEARLSRNQTIEELASNLKIGAHQLKAIEDGIEDLLPEQVYVKAMVRRISEKLKLDTAFIMNEFKTEREEIKIEEIIQEVSNKAEKNKKVKETYSNNAISFVIFIFISGILGLLASSFILNIFSDSFQEQAPKKELIRKN